jgi:hypothetical protein
MAAGAKRGRAILGRIENISQGGVAVVSSVSMPISSLVRCEIRGPDVGIAIPTLLQVRWSRKRASGTEYEVGLRFVL